MIPRPVVVIVVVVLLLLLMADIGAQLVVPGHTASVVIDGAILTLLGSIIVGTKGPKPETEPPPPDPPIAETGRHRGSSP